jgi:hypothetical protein
LIADACGGARVLGVTYNKGRTEVVVIILVPIRKMRGGTR